MAVKLSHDKFDINNDKFDSKIFRLWLFIYCLDRDKSLVSSVKWAADLTTKFCTHRVHILGNSRCKRMHPPGFPSLVVFNHNFDGTYS